MAEYIDRDALLRKKHGCDRKDCSNCDFFTDGDSWCQGELFAVDVLNAPAADVVERKTGVWIGEGDGYADGNMVYDMWYCGACGARFDEWEEEPDWKYCPVCGSYNGDDEDV